MVAYSNSVRRPFRWSWPSTPSTAGVARRAVTSALERCGIVSDDIPILVSELVTNAVMHGVPPVRAVLRLLQCGEDVSVVFEVYDGSPIPLVAAEDREDYGRGLMLVSSIADVVGVSKVSDGKTVWFLQKVEVRG